MKKIHLLLLGLTICLFTACHDKLWDAIDDLDVRVARLEELCKEMNTNIVSIQTIVNVVQSGDYITGVTEIKKDGEVIGYTITFANHDPITIYHGQDGKDGADGKDGQGGQNGSANTPVIGVAQDTDGVYYWTLNGEWLLDNNGNKIAVSDITQADGSNGADGSNSKDGITPQLKIEDGYWYVSYDNGTTWTQLGKATGEDGEKGDKGDTGDSMFQSVTQDENYVYFTLADGTVIKIAKGSGSNDQPNAEDIINFRDLAVKSALLKLGVDTTHDGEISYGEAARFEGEFKSEYYIGGNTSIYSFKEFQYFTGVTSIGEYAFSGCTNLVEITIPNSVTNIEMSAFKNCRSLATISIPYGVPKIEPYTFQHCESLIFVSIPSSVKSIGNEAFQWCNIYSVTIPDSVTSIGESAFDYCSHLSSITVGSGVMNIESYAFGSSSLESIYFKGITPPKIGFNIFNAEPPTIYVPRESVDKYKKASRWSDYANKIVGYDFE